MIQLLSGSFFVLYLFITPGQGSDIYKQIYDRANQRTTRTYLKSFHKYTVEHEALVKDVVENCSDKSVVQQYEIFKQLTKDLGMAEMAEGSFNSRAVAARKKSGMPQRISRRPKVGVVAEKLLNSFLEQVPNITAQNALEALERQWGSDSNLPSISEVANWLKYRKDIFRFSGPSVDEPREIEKNNKRQRLDEQVSAPPVSSSSSSDEKFWNDMRQVFSDDYEEEVVRAHRVTEQISSTSSSSSSASDDEFWNEMRQVFSDDHENVVQAQGSSLHSDRRGVAVEEGVPSRESNENSMFAESQTYRTILERANQRMAEAPVARRDARKKYTSRHTALIMDIVQTFKKEESLPKLYEFFSSLLKDLHMVEMTRSTFYDRAGRLRREIAGYCCPSMKKPAVGVEASKSLENIFEGNPKISEADAFKALAMNINTGDALSLPRRRDVRSWLKYRRASRHILGEKHQQSQTVYHQASTSSSDKSDQDFRNDMASILRDPDEEDAHNVESLLNLDDEQSSRKRGITTQF